MCDDENDQPRREVYKFVIRLPDGMRDLIADLASSNRRSMNSEIVTRLEMSLAQEGNLSDDVTDKVPSPELTAAEMVLLQQFRQLGQPRQRALVSLIDDDITEA